MYEINVLPWRSQRRKQAQIQFFSWIAASALSAGLVGIIGWYLLTKNYEIETGRTDYIQDRIMFVNKQLGQIKKIDDNRRIVSSRMNVISGLEGDRHYIVRLFDTIASSIPDGIYLSSITFENGKAILQGYTTSNKLISDVMRRLDSSTIITNPNLKSVRHASLDEVRLGEGYVNRFELEVTQVNSAIKGTEKVEKH